MATTAEFAASYASMLDGELERISLDVSSLVSNAREALRREMERRELQTETISWDCPDPERCEYDTSVNWNALAIDRYRNGYSIANAVARFGATVKVIGIFLGGLISVGGLVAAHEWATGAFIFLLTGVCVAFAGYCIGVLVVSAGELLKALFDTAVNGSHFLDDDDRATVMFS